MEKLSPDDLFTTKQTAEILGVTSRTLRYWNEKKLFQPFIIDHKGDFRYSREQISMLKSVYHKGWENIYKTDFPTISSGQNVKLGDFSGGKSTSDFFSKPANQTVRRLNVQVYPSKKRVEINEKMARVCW